MAKKDPKVILWENVQALMKEQYGAVILARLAEDTGLAPANMTRLKQAKTSIGMDMVAEIARALKVELWQLLIEGLAADKPPALAAPSNAWPFQDVTPERFHALSDLQKAKIEGALLNMVSQFENASESSAGKAKTQVGRSGLSGGAQKRVQTTPQDLKSLKETKPDVPTNSIPGKGKTGPGTNKKA